MDLQIHLMRGSSGVLGLDRVEVAHGVAEVLPFLAEDHVQAGTDRHGLSGAGRDTEAGGPARRRPVSRRGDCDRHRHAQAGWRASRNTSRPSKPRISPLVARRAPSRWHTVTPWAAASRGDNAGGQRPSRDCKSSRRACSSAISAASTAIGDSPASDGWSGAPLAAGT